MRSDIVANGLGLILIGFGAITLSPVIVALLDRDYDSILPFCVAALVAILVGIICRQRGGWEKNFDRIKRTEGMLVVTLAWVCTAAVGAIPYLFYGLHPLDAYFESASGITTTGATILTDFSLYPKTFFFWRSLTQWLGGMGIIVLFVAILPQFSVAGRQLFFTEAPGPTEDKMTPRITNTAKSLWLIYVLLTVVEIFLLHFWAGFPVYDAVCNGLTTLAAGGFSPHPLSIMGYDNPTATWIITFFMFLAGANFALQYRLIIRRKPGSLLGSEEFCFYCIIIITLSVLLCSFLYFQHSKPLAESVRDSFFQIISIITTAGFSSADFALWAIPAQIMLVFVMYVGGCAGSAGGGIKVVRILFLGKYLLQELKYVLHPKAVLSVKIDKKTVPSDIQRQIIGFLFFFITLSLISGFLVTIIEGNSMVGFIGTAATIGNIGPGFGDIGPMGTFGNLTPLTKIIFITNMVAGRLELIPFLVMFRPDFWK